ncbi:MAG: phospholipid carrier-dependent glycosyltransferase [Lachnospiraceae bacterium]|jgi:dolichyl-phosphate-mannose--protein O-mannosyl transferase|nr:phospholipid carrier-dependent glycosyltransferase [Lachnospiraceae bacterium]
MPPARIIKPEIEIVMNKRDCITMSVLTLAFAVMAFYRLGSFAIPQSGYEATGENRTITLDFGEDVSLNRLVVFPGRLGFFGDFYMREDGGAEWVLLKGDVEVARPYSWGLVPLPGRFRYLRLEARNMTANFNEMVFIDYLERRLMPVNAADYPALFDEQGLYDRYLSHTYYNVTIFDEAFYARAAYDYINGLPPGETAHPPLGKSIISLGSRAFGMNPFGWRSMAAVFGIMTVPLMYAFAKALLSNSFAATATAALLVFDCMHFTLSRIGTIDTIAGFWILLMYYLFWRYLQMNGRLTTAPTTDVVASPHKFPRSYLPLALCGLVFGLAAATKWTGLFAGAGLALLFLYHLIKHRPPQIKRLLAFCTVFFVVLPALIYVLSFRPVVADPPVGGLLATAADYTKQMFAYHTAREYRDNVYSLFYEWPFVWRPMLYISEPLDFTFISSVNLLGNPAIWWFGLPCLVFCLYRALRKKDAPAGFLVTAYLAQYLPWFFKTDVTFIYHYYPATLFMLPAIGYTLDAVARAKQWGRTAVYGYLAVAAAVFVIFYPVTSGQPATFFYQTGLEWLPEWYLVMG